MPNLITEGGGGGLETGKKWLRNMWTVPIKNIEFKKSLHHSTLIIDFIKKILENVLCWKFGKMERCLNDCIKSAYQISPRMIPRLRRGITTKIRALKKPKFYMTSIWSNFQSKVKNWMCYGHNILKFVSLLNSCSRLITHSRNKVNRALPKQDAMLEFLCIFLLTIILFPPNIIAGFIFAIFS